MLPCSEVRVPGVPGMLVDIGGLVRPSSVKPVPANRASLVVLPFLEGGN